MNLMKNMLTPPGEGLMHLLPLLIISVLFIHIYFLSVLLASTGTSLAFSKKNPGLSSGIAGLYFGKSLTVLLFSFLPLIILQPLFRLAVFDSGLRSEQYFLTGLIVLTAALTLIRIYHQRGAVIAGISGTLLLLLYFFMMAVILSLFIFPEKWPFITGIFPFPLFSVTPVFLFLLLMAVSMINTGAALGFKNLRWKETALPKNSELRSHILMIGNGLILAGTLLLPPFLFLLIFTLPGYSMGGNIFPPLIILLLLTVMSAYPAFPGIRRSGHMDSAGHTLSFVLSILITLTMTVVLVNLQRHANIDRVDLAGITAEKRRETAEAERLDIYSRNMVITPEFGEKIFRERCTACHDFNKRILGPPFNSVIPKYRDDPEKMAGFILNPVKVNPDFPSMPNPGLSTWEAKSVVQFILGNENKTTGEKSE
jgi:cytochrome c551/c552